jgi:uridine kinase
VWIGVDGPGGAGKSTFARRIARSIDRAVVVSVDDFSGPSFAEWDWGRFHAQLVHPLVEGSTAHFQRWDWDRDEGVEWVDVQPASVVVVEGVSSMRTEVALSWALTIWVDTPRELRLSRALERDGSAMLTTWLSNWIPSEEAYIATQHPQARADLIVRGDEPA